MDYDEDDPQTTKSGKTPKTAKKPPASPKPKAGKAPHAKPAKAGKIATPHAHVKVPPAGNILKKKGRR